MVWTMGAERASAPQWEAAASAINCAQSVLAVAHFAPDGDALGSLLGIALPLRSLGKDVIAAIDDGVPSELRFLPGCELVVSSVTDGEFDLMIAVDCSDWNARARQAPTD